MACPGAEDDDKELPISPWQEIACVIIFTVIACIFLHDFLVWLTGGPGG